jgi:hypothetical protein
LEQALNLETQDATRKFFGALSPYEKNVADRITKTYLATEKARGIREQLLDQNRALRQKIRFEAMDERMARRREIEIQAAAAKTPYDQRPVYNLEQLLQLDKIMMSEKKPHVRAHAMRSVYLSEREIRTLPAARANELIEEARNTAYRIAKRNRANGIHIPVYPSSDTMDRIEAEAVAAEDAAEDQAVAEEEATEAALRAKEDHLLDPDLTAVQDYFAIAVQVSSTWHLSHLDLLQAVLQPKFNLVIPFPSSNTTSESLREQNAIVEAFATPVMVPPTYEETLKVTEKIFFPTDAVPGEVLVEWTGHQKPGRPRYIISDHDAEHPTIEKVPASEAEPAMPDARPRYWRVNQDGKPVPVDHNGKEVTSYTPDGNPDYPPLPDSGLSWEVLAVQLAACALGLLVIYLIKNSKPPKSGSDRGWFPPPEPDHTEKGGPHHSFTSKESSIPVEDREPQRKLGEPALDWIKRWNAWHSELLAKEEREQLRRTQEMHNLLGIYEQEIKHALVCYSTPLGRLFIYMHRFLHSFTLFKLPKNFTINIKKR